MKSHFVQTYLDITKKFIIDKFKHPLHLIKFLLVSGSAVVLNLLLLYLLVTYCGMGSSLGENIANFVSMEISVIYNFFMSRAITWQDRRQEKGRQLVYQLLKFHITIGITMLLRVVLFFFLQLTGLHYLINATIGIAMAAAVNFVIYDTLIFQKKET
jgi:dolichol-phosphate mannosyltransferase